MKGSNEITITVIGRKTKRKFSTPVWFVLDGKTVLLVPTKGSDNDWFKNLVEDPWIELGVGKISVASKATLVRDPNRVKEIVDKLKVKYRSMWSESYYSKRDVCVEVPV